MAGSNSLSQEDIEFIDSRLKERHSFKRERYYDEADAIREELREKYAVNIDDRTKEWSVESAPEFSVVDAGVVEYSAEDEDLDAALEAMLDDSEQDFSEEERYDEIEDDSEEEEEEEEEIEDEVPSMTEEELSGLTVPVLKEKLKEAGLPVSGRKADLISRLLG